MELKSYIERLNQLPDHLEKIVSAVREKGLMDKPIRDNAWTCRQVINHLPDSLMNSVIRVKFALTEDKPVLQGYNQDNWAELVDSRDVNVEYSLLIMRGLCIRTAKLLKSLSDEQLERTYIHSENGEMSIKNYLVDIVEHGYNHLVPVSALF